MTQEDTPGDRIRTEREARGWTQQRLAKEARIPNARQSFISAIEGNRQRHSKHYSAIIRALNLNEDWVLTGRGVKYLSAPDGYQAAEGAAPAYSHADPLIREAVSLLEQTDTHGRERCLSALRLILDLPDSFVARTGND